MTGYVFRSNLTEGGTGYVFASNLTSPSVAPISLNCLIDCGNVDPSSIIDNPTSPVPTILLQRRLNAGDWRHLFVEIIDGEGYRPVFKAPRTTRNSNPTPGAGFRPCYTQNGEDWIYATSITLEGGTSGTINWQFDDPFPAGPIFVATQPLGRNIEAATLTQRLLTDYPGIASPTPVSNELGVFHTSPSEMQDGRQCGLQPMYAVQLRFGGSTLDGGPKRKLVIAAGIHAAGEQTSWIPFMGQLNHILDGEDDEAVRIRADFDIDLYYNLSPNGVFSGDNRTNPTRGSDPNRIWNSPNNEIAATQAAILSNLAGGRFDCFFSWHSWGSETRPFLMYVSPTENNPATRSPITQAFRDIGQTIFGVAPVGTSSGTNNTDVWWAMQNGATAAFDTETPQNGDTSIEFLSAIGVNWTKTLAEVDSQGLFVEPVESVVTSTGYVQAQRATASGVGASGTATGSGQVNAQRATTTGSGRRIVRGTGSALARRATATAASGSQPLLLSRSASRRSAINITPKLSAVDATPKYSATAL